MNSDQPELVESFTPGNFAEMAVNAAIEHLTNIKPVSETDDLHNDKSVSEDERKEEQLASVINESRSELTTTLSRSVFVLH